MKSESSSNPGDNANAHKFLQQNTVVYTLYADCSETSISTTLDVSDSVQIRLIYYLDPQQIHDHDLSITL